MNWVVTTISYDRPGDPYVEHINPLTFPLMEAYADRHGMDFRVLHVTPQDAAPFRYIPTRGTEAVFASWQQRIALHDEYDGVIYFDGDLVVVDPRVDLRDQVNSVRCIGLPRVLCGAIMVTLGDKGRELLQHVWNHREDTVGWHWAEEALVKRAFGWQWDYHQCGHNNRESYPMYKTIWTPHLAYMPDVLGHPSDYAGEPFLNPGGIWPVEERIRQVQHYAEEARNALR